jgi:hypothetical protein
MVMVNGTVVSVMVEAMRNAMSVMATALTIVKPVMEKDTWKMKKEMK